MDTQLDNSTRVEAPEVHSQVAEDTHWSKGFLWPAHPKPEMEDGYITVIGKRDHTDTF